MSSQSLLISFKMTLLKRVMTTHFSFQFKGTACSLEKNHSHIRFRLRIYGHIPLHYLPYYKSKCSLILKLNAQKSGLWSLLLLNKGRCWEWKHKGTGFNSPPVTQTSSRQLTNEQDRKKTKPINVHGSRFHSSTFWSNELCSSSASYSKCHTCLRLITLAIRFQ